MGDIDGNGRVTLDDFYILAKNYGTVDPNSFPPGDLNKDHVVSTADYAVLQGNFGLSDAGVPPLPNSRFKALAITDHHPAPNITFVEVPISAGAVADDPALAGAHCYRIGVSNPGPSVISSAGLNVVLTSGSFYNEENTTKTGYGGIAVSDPSLWNTPGKRQLAFDTFVASPESFSFANPLILGNYPETSNAPVSTATRFSVSWGTVAPYAGTGSYFAQLTVIGTTLSASDVIPEPAGLATLLICGLMLTERSHLRRKRRD
jgi:hypothetical protein